MQVQVGGFSKWLGTMYDGIVERFGKTCVVEISQVMILPSIQRFEIVS
jgi:hypothetical protein